MARAIKTEVVVKDKATSKIKKLEKSTTESFDKMKKSAAGLSSSWKSMLAPIAAVTAAATGVIKVFKDNVAYGDKLNKVSTRLGISAKSLDKLNKIADLSAVSHEKLATSLQRLTRRVAEAAQGTGVAKDALKELGLDANKLMQMPLDQKFLAVASALDKVKNPGDKVRLTMKLMDSEGVSLIQMFKNLRSVFNSMLSVWDDQSANEMAEFTDNLSIMVRALGDLSVAITQETVSILNDLVDIKGDPDALKEWSENSVGYIRDVVGEAKEAAHLIWAVFKPVWQLAGEIEDVFKDFEARRKKINALLEERKNPKHPTTKMFKMPEKPKALETPPSEVEADKEALDKIKEIQERTQRELNDLVKLSADEKFAILTEEYRKESSLFIEHNESIVNLYKAYKLKSLAIAKKVSDERNAISKAEQEKKRRIIEQYADILGSNMGDAFASMVQGSKDAKEAFADMAAGIAADLTRMMIKMVIYKSIASAVGFSVGGYSGWGSTSTNTSTSTAAEGAIFQGGFQAFANGGVAKKPTLGLIGEGKYNEAIVPLPNGKAIPVDMKNEGNSTIINNNITVESSGGDATKDREQAQIIAQALDVKIRQALIQHQRPGGLLHRGR